jgi:predicted SAM-dependent methyltransferase
VPEHFDREDDARFRLENVRMLKPGGALRIVVPDLEDICRIYLEALDAAERGDSAPRRSASGRGLSSSTRCRGAAPAAP